MTHDSCSYIVSAAPLPLQNYITLLLTVGFQSFPSFVRTPSFPISRSSSLSFSSVLEPLRSAPLSFPLSSALTSLARSVQILLCSRGWSTGVRGVMIGAQKKNISIKITLLPKYPASNTKTAKPDDGRIIFQSLDACRKSPQSPADTLLPCIKYQWQLCSPMDST